MAERRPLTHRLLWFAALWAAGAAAVAAVAYGIRLWLGL
jgi:hypothetical protein